MNNEHGSEGLAEVIASMTPYIEKKIYGMAVPGLETGDLRQEAFIALFKALDTYEPGRNASFFTYAVTCIDNRLNDAVRWAASGKNSAINGSESLSSEEIVPVASDEPSPADIAEAREELENVRELIGSRLSDLERKALIMQLQGYSVAEIAGVCGVDARSVSNALNRARKKLKN